MQKLDLKPLKPAARFIRCEPLEARPSQHDWLLIHGAGRLRNQEMDEYGKLYEIVEISPVFSSSSQGHRMCLEKTPTKILQNHEHPRARHVQSRHLLLATKSKQSQCNAKPKPTCPRYAQQVMTSQSHASQAENLGHNEQTSRKTHLGKDKHANSNHIPLISALPQVPSA